MSKRRVVITGIGLKSPVGDSMDEVSHALRTGRHGIVSMPEWDAIGNLQTRLAALVSSDNLSGYPRKKVRTMGRVSLLSTWATQQAVLDANLTEEILQSGGTGLAYGSTHGSSTELESFCRSLFTHGSLAGLAGSSYLKFMSHTCAANLAQFFGIRGRVIPTTSACASASQAIGVGYESVKHGLSEVMICGGAEEMHFVHAGVFDIVYATSVRYNNVPDRSPRPFDKDRDGLVVGEGAGTVVLETLEHAEARNARIYGEIIGYGTNCDGEHVIMPSREGMAGAIALSVQDAGIDPKVIDYVNAHGTATEVGDIAESHATLDILGANVPISSTKGHTGHTLGACGAIEAIFCLTMMRDGFLAPGRNLDQVDPRCAELDYIKGEPRRANPGVIMTNNFAFGGINTSLILRSMK